MPRIRSDFGHSKREKQFASIRGIIRSGMENSFIRTQKELARRTHIDPSTLSRHLNDMEQMTLRELFNICEQTGLTVEVRGKANDV